MNRTLLVCVGISLLASAAFSRACGGQRPWGRSGEGQQRIIVVYPPGTGGTNNGGTGGTGTTGTGITGTGAVGTSNLEEDDELFLARRRRDTHDDEESKTVSHKAGAAFGFKADVQSGSHDTKGVKSGAAVAGGGAYSKSNTLQSGSHDTKAVKLGAGAFAGLGANSKSNTGKSGTNEKKGIVGGAGGITAAIAEKKTTESKSGKYEKNGGVIAAGGIVGGVFEKHTGKEEKEGKIAGGASLEVGAASKSNTDKSVRSTNEYKGVEAKGKAAGVISGAIASKINEKETTGTKSSTNIEKEGKTDEEAAVGSAKGAFGGHLKAISEKQTTEEKGGKREAEFKEERGAGITVGAAAGLAGKRTAHVNENGSLTEKSKEINGKVGIGFGGNAEINKQVKESIEDKNHVKKGKDIELKGGAGFSIIGEHKSKTDSVVKT